MTVDLRNIVATDLGICLSGDVGSNHISDRSGLQMFSGRLIFDGIVTPPRGTLISFLVASPQTGKVTRFPHPLRVIRAVADPIERRSEIEVGCRLTLMQNKKFVVNYYSSQYIPPWASSLSDRQESTIAIPIYAAQVLGYCLSQIGIIPYKNSPTLGSVFLRQRIDLSAGYVSIIGDLLRSECCFGRMRPDETFEIVPIRLTTGQKGPVLYTKDLVSIEPITTGSEPATSYTVKYNAIRRTA